MTKMDQGNSQQRGALLRRQPLVHRLLGKGERLLQAAPIAIIGTHHAQDAA